MSPSSRRAWIEIRCLSPRFWSPPSPSSRRAWIEIPQRPRRQLPSRVALLAEGVDRNRHGGGVLRTHAESPSSRRAWIEIFCCCSFSCWTKSPSSRRAWIEIISIRVSQSCRCVALLAEGVDRNPLVFDFDGQLVKSPSSRRAWIEISGGPNCPHGTQSPSSRRAWIEIHNSSLINGRKSGRPPRGGRG